MKPFLLIGLCALILVACTPVQQYPQITCPVLTCPDCSLQDDSVYLYFINVGQGDSILIKYQDTEMLIDCGLNNMGPAVVDFLEEKKIAKLEYMVVTGPDSDHSGGCDDVLSHIPTQTVITNGQTAETTSYREVMDEIDTEQLIVGEPGRLINIGPAKLTLLQSYNNFSGTNENSIVSLLEYGTEKVLLTGDCDRRCEDLLMEKDIANITILKVAHHGSKYGTEIDFLEKTNPQIAVISVGSNSYGHPAEETLDRLNQEGIITYRTDIHGTVGVKLNINSYEIIS